MIHLSVVIPCYNEEENINNGALEKVADFFKKKRYPYEVIISDDGSNDKSAKLIKSFIKSNPNFVLIENKHLGKPYAVKSGILKAKGKYILFSDLDQSTPIGQVDKLLPYFDQGFDIAIGSRGVFRKNAPFYRKIMAIAFLTVRRAIILRKIVDTQCGFKCFRNKIAKELFSGLKIYSQENEEIIGGRVTAFDVEVLFLASIWGYKIKEVPVLWEYTKTNKIDYVRESISMAKETFRVLVNNRRGVYGKK